MDLRNQTDHGGAAATNANRVPNVVPPMRVPGRVYLGAVLAGIAVAGLVALGLIGAAEAPAQAEFRFTRGVEFAPGEEARLRGHLIELAADPDRFVRIVGHTGVQGDGDANQDLSEQRAAVAASVARDVGVPDERLLTVTGVGGGAPLANDQGLGHREWERSLSRVTILDQATP